MAKGRDEVDGGETYDGMTVVLCIGNRYMGDDGVGREVAGRLRGMDLGPGVLVRESVSVDLTTLWEFRAARRLLVVDAVTSGDRPGTVTRHLLLGGDRTTPKLAGLHGLDLGSAVDLAAPEILGTGVVVVGVEPKDCGAREGLTPEVEAAVTEAVEAILSELSAAGAGRRV